MVPPQAAERIPMAQRTRRHADRSARLCGVAPSALMPRVQSAMASMRCTGQARGGIIAVVVTGALLAGVGSAAASGSQWTSAGGNLQNTRLQAGEETLSVSNVAGLEKKGEVTTGGGVSATPAGGGGTVDFPCRGGNPL